MQLDFTWERREQLIRKEEYNDGKADGRAEGVASAILDLLEDLGPVPGQLREEIYAISDLEALRRLHKLAARADSTEEFEQTMRDCNGID